MPVRPHATPKAAAPATNLLSTSLKVLVGTENLLANDGGVVSPFDCISTRFGRTANTMIRSKDGSQYFQTGKERKEVTLSGCDI